MNQSEMTLAGSGADTILILSADRRDSMMPIEQNPGIIRWSWSHYAPNQTFQFFGIVRRDGDQYGAEALTLPGVFAYGSTKVEAVNRLREAVAATIESYLAQGEEIPWQAVDPASLDTRDAAFAGWLQAHVV